MLKRTFHDLIEIKKKVAKLEKSKSAKTSKKRRRIITVSSSSDEEPTGSRSKCVKRKDPPIPMAATSSTQEPEKAKPPAESSSRRKSSEAKGSRDGNKEPKSLTGIQDKFWRNVTRNLTIATADLLMYIKQYIFIFYGSNPQLDRHLYITRKILE